MLLEPMGPSFENAQRMLTGQVCWDHNAACLQSGKNFVETSYSHTPETQGRGFVRPWWFLSA